MPFSADARRLFRKMSENAWGLERRLIRREAKAPRSERPFARVFGSIVRDLINLGVLLGKFLINDGQEMRFA